MLRSLMFHYYNTVLCSPCPVLHSWAKSYKNFLSVYFFDNFDVENDVSRARKMIDDPYTGD